MALGKISAELLDYTIELVEEKMEVDYGTIRARGRPTHDAGRARYVLCLILKQEFNFSQRQIASHFGWNKSTVDLGIRRMKALMEKDSSYVAVYDAVVWLLTHEA